MIRYSRFKLPARITAFLAGLGLLGGIFCPGEAEAGYRKAPEKYQEVDTQVLQSGPTLLFSDSPETVYENGILYRDIVEGESRVFFHHVNGTKNTRKLAVLLRPVHRLTTVTWGCRGIGDPDKEYYISARKGQRRYFTDYREFWNRMRRNVQNGERNKREKNNKNNSVLPDYSFYGKVPDLPVTVLPREGFTEVLSQGADMRRAGIRIKPEQLLTGMFDFHASHPVEVVIMMCDPDDDIEKFARNASALPMDSHPLRGTYRKADLTYIVKKPVKMKWYQARALCMAGSEDPYFLTGKDRLTGNKTTNHGNYGVVYHIIYSVDGGDAIELGINPWGGGFYGAGLMLSDDKAVLLNIPGKKSYFGKGDELDDIFVHSPQHERKDAEFIWSPPGASNLPIRAFWTVNRLENRKES